jgi:hypothetical protein
MTDNNQQLNLNQNQNIFQNNNQIQKPIDNLISLNQNPNTNLLIHLPPNFGANNNKSNNIIKKIEDIPISNIIEIKKQQDREPLLAGYRNMNLPPNNFDYQEEKKDSFTLQIMESPMLILLIVICLIIYGLIFYMISAQLIQK